MRACSVRRMGHLAGDAEPGSVAAVVLAAGAATRFGSPKQPLLLDEVLDPAGAERRARRDRRRRRRVRAGDGCAPRPLHRLGARPRSLAALRTTRARRRDVRRGGDPRRRARPLAGGRRPRRHRMAGGRRPTCWQRRTAVSAAIPVVLDRAVWAVGAGRGSACARSRCSSRATTSARPATWTIRRI